MAAPMTVDSGRSSEESRPLSSEVNVMGPFAKFRNALAIIEHVQKLITDSVIWNKHQCKRVADRYSLIADGIALVLKSMNWDGISVGEASDGGSSSSEDVDELIDVLKRGESLISCCDESQAGITNVISRTNNPEAFEEHHGELDDVVAKVGLLLEGGATGPTSVMEKTLLTADAKADLEEIPEILSGKPNLKNVARVITEKISGVDVKKLVQDNVAEKLPSYLKISRTEIAFGKPVRPIKRNSDRDPKTEEGWAVVRTGRWLGYEFATKVFDCNLKGDDAGRADWNRKQLLMEVGSLIELQHPHVVRVVGFGQDSEKSLFVMEKMDGDLRCFMNEAKNPFNDREKLDVISQIAKGMHFIHTKGYAHGDLKCSNVVVKNSGQYLQVKIADLRGSQKRDQWNPEAFKQASATRRPRWTAPEALGYDCCNEPPEWEFLEKMDIYSFGMTCYEIVTGQWPFHGIRGEDLEKKLKERERPILPETLDENLKELIKSCWDQEPSKRPSFEEICQALDYIRSKISPVTKDRPCGPAAMLKFQLTQFTAVVLDQLKNTRLLGPDQSQIGSGCFAPKQLIIPEHLKIEPKQLSRGELIGEGTFSRVYKTTWLRCTVAEKRMRKTNLVTEIMQEEIDSLIRVSRHPCIGLLVGFSINSESEECSIIMEYMDGNLQKLIDTRLKKLKGAYQTRKQPFDFREEVLIISNIALGMAYLHFWGVVHRDLKPANVLAQEHSNFIDVKIVDFGLSHLESSDIQATKAYYSGTGTGFYRAPEMLPAEGVRQEELSKLGLPDISAKLDLEALKATDVFSFAMVCYEVLTGIPPFSGIDSKAYDKVRSEDNILEWPVNSDLELNSRLQLKSLVDRCRVLNPTERPNFGSICEELSKIHS